MCKKEYNDSLPRFGVTSCLREHVTPCFLAGDILPRWGRDTLPSRTCDTLSRSCIAVRFSSGRSEGKIEEATPNGNTRKAQEICIGRTI